MTPESAYVSSPDASSRWPEVDYSTAYERLRACVKGDTAQVPVTGVVGRPAAGLGLVLQEGVAGWLKAYARMCCASLDTVPKQQTVRSVESELLRAGEDAASASNPVLAEILPLPQQSGLTLLIANLVVSAQRSDVLSARMRESHGPFQAGGACR